MAPLLFVAVARPLRWGCHCVAADAPAAPDCGCAARMRGAAPARLVRAGRDRPLPGLRRPVGALTQIATRFVLLLIHRETEVKPCPSWRGGTPPSAATQWHRRDEGAPYFRDTSPTPTITRAMPNRWWRLVGSWSQTTASSRVNTGPTQPKMVARVAPMRWIASATM